MSNNQQILVIDQFIFLSVIIFERQAFYQPV